jgi:hypothetical protein
MPTKILMELVSPPKLPNKEPSKVKRTWEGSERTENQMYEEQFHGMS